jgi:hypothetical protein
MDVAAGDTAINTAEIHDRRLIIPQIATTNLPDGSVTAPKLASGSAVDNIGYTPVNKAGDTMTGAISVPGITSTGGSDIKLQAPSGSTDSGDLVFHDGAGAEIARFWNSGGRFFVRFSGTDPAKEIWHAGNFDPNTKASLTGATFTGSIFAPKSHFNLNSATEYLEAGQWANLTINSTNTSGQYPRIIFHNSGESEGYIQMNAHKFTISRQQASAMHFEIAKGNFIMNNAYQALNFRIENRTTDPASPAVGQIWLRTDL